MGNKVVHVAIVSNVSTGVSSQDSYRGVAESYAEYLNQAGMSVYLVESAGAAKNKLDSLGGGVVIFLSISQLRAAQTFADDKYSKIKPILLTGERGSRIVVLPKRIDPDCLVGVINAL